ncbi:YafY family protein [Gordonia sp. (in: high G+C Gram-positive bacteria)]|uniref:helix-turn-helix transcriptional regulator n=1 Tax=Gordonia sp. (in: high G+C Gram-positive bacteria) TaxID=84139 RepID=UPI0016B71A9A|nr:transcriptional regulator [Gordonia sp. (in: high G+C Gram-positive bacteria)]NLG46471.1 transcriptional regulator [Gordonia sp. (in: high G+C Gram-positive bacteria)]
MADTTTRTLKLLALLQAHRLWSAIELADRLGTTERTVRRDVERLRELGYPVESVRGTGGGYQLAPGGSLPPLVVDEEEAVAIVSALRTAASGSAAGLAEASVRALAKVMQVLPPKLQRRADALRAMSVVLPGEYQAPPIDAETLTTVALACRDATELTFTYAPGERSGSAPGARRTEPLRLVPVGRRWYLLAYDLDRQDWRTFRLDRLRDAKPQKRRFAPRAVPGGDPAAYVRAGLRHGRDHQRVRAVVHADPDAVRHQIGRWSEVAAHADGALVVMHVDDPGWLALALGGLDADYEFLEIPADLLRDLRGRNARQARALYLADRETDG